MNRNRIKRTGVWLLVMYMFVVAVPILISAHSDIEGSNPKEKEVLHVLPSHVSVTFRENIQPSGFNSLTVTGESGERVDVGNTEIDGNVMKVGLQESIPNGIYYMQWRVISADGHPIQGTIPFGIEITEQEAKELQADTTGYVPQADMIIGRGALYAGFSLYAGAMLFHLVLYRGNEHVSAKLAARSRTAVSLAGILILGSMLLNLPLQATITAGVSWLEAFHPALWKETLQLPDFGLYWVVQTAFASLLVLATFLFIRRGRLSSWKVWIVPLLLLIGLFVMKAAYSHAASSKYKEVAVVINFLHLSSASLWIGGIAAILFILPVHGKQDWSVYWEAIRRFSPWALTAGAIMLFTGLISSTMFVTSLHALADTGYGIVLIIKVSLFIVMSILGLFHLIQGKLRREKRLGVTAWTELGAGISILLLTAALTNLQPPSFLEAEPFNETKQMDNGYAVTLQISPNAVGVNTFDIQINDEDGNPASDIAQVALVVSAVGMGMERPPFLVPAVSAGRFQTEGDLTMTGQWNIRIRVLTTSGESLRVDFSPVVGNRERS